MSKPPPEIAKLTGVEGAAGGDPGAGDEDQLSLLALEPMLGEVKRGKGAVLNKIGRPKGSINRRSRDLAAYILSRHRNPIEAAAEIVDAPVADLARALKCDLVVALGEWRKCAEFVARYTLQPMPQQVNVTTPLAGYLTVINLSAPRPGEEMQLSSYGLDMQIKQNQGLSIAVNGQSHDIDAKPLISLDADLKPD